jgi:biopolymer transport protein ExbD
VRTFRSRIDDMTFDLNLAPMLDVIVSIIPMLLLSVVFVQINIIESPLPQVVQNAINNEKEKDTSVSLLLSKTKPKFIVERGGQQREFPVPATPGVLNLGALHQQAVQIKTQHPEIFSLSLLPEPNLSLEEIVQVMDILRNKKHSDPVFTFTDKESGKPVQTDLIFPNIVFSNIVGE